MKKLIVEGNNRLNGLVCISGAKNASLPILMASILIGGKSKIFNVPSVADITTTIELLTHLGASLEIDNNTIDGKKLFTVDTTTISTVEAPYEIVSKMRASFWVLGSLLGRFGEAKVSLPGGCAIGPRPCDIYIDVLEQMGVDIRVVNGYVVAKAKSRDKKLKGAEVTLRLPSVGATHNTVMAATLAVGRTTIRNAAKEPEIVDLCNYLINAGADISGMGTETIVVNGVNKLYDNEYKVMGDRIEAFTYMVASAITKGDLILDGIDFNNTLKTPIEVLKSIGLEFNQISNDKIRVFYDRPLKPTNVMTQVFPGFPTDTQASVMALLGKIQGTSTIEETIFENRFMHVPELNRLGANISVSGNVATISGVKDYSGANVMASDLRAGMALVLAGLAADGITEINRIYHIDRGYENFVDKLSSCGAKMEVVDDKE